VSHLRLLHFLQEEDGQDFTEYALLLAFVTLASAAILSSIAVTASSIWRHADALLAAHDT
jgi:Flp pilus assembly pilin Flp